MATKITHGQPELNMASKKISEAQNIYRPGAFCLVMAQCPPRDERERRQFVRLLRNSFLGFDRALVVQLV